MAAGFEAHTRLPRHAGRCMTATPSKKTSLTSRRAPSSTPSWAATTVCGARLEPAQAKRCWPPRTARRLTYSQVTPLLQPPASKPTTTRRLLRPRRHHLCVWADGHRQVVYNGGQERPARPARHHPQRVQLHIRHDRAGGCGVRKRGHARKQLEVQIPAHTLHGGAAPPPPRGSSTRPSSQPSARFPPL